MENNSRRKCFFSRVKEAFALKKAFELYVCEKEVAKSEPVKTSAQDCLYTKVLIKNKAKNLGKQSSGSKKTCNFDHFLTEDSIQNFIFKSVLGFLGGILLTYISFMFLVFSLNFTLKRATYICMGLGAILSLGLAFSVKIRCTVFLCIPQLFSKRGRQALLAYAFILALSGPAKNTLHNVEVMSESLACGQEQIKQAENELLKCIQRPNAAVKKSAEKLLVKLNSAVKYFKNFVLQFYRIYLDILETLSHAQKWLYSISLLCKDKMGNASERCQNLLMESSENCQGANELLYWKRLCEINPFAVKLICATTHQEVCFPSDVCSLPSIEILQKQINDFKCRALNILYVKVEVCQTYAHLNHSGTFHEEYQGMATEIRQKTDQFLQYFDFMSVIFGIFILVLFVKVIIYRHKFLTEDHYDNRFITPDFEDIDNTRAEFKMETVLPLKPREKTKYIKVTSIRLVPCEKIRLLSSFIFLIFATFKIIIHMLTDSSLYWILSSVRRDERMLYMSTLNEEEPGVTATIKGEGMVAQLLQNITDVIRKHYSTPKLDPTPCLPDPVSPDWNRYYQILALVSLCWLLALLEPYGLRLRHTVMVTYHPDRARERAIWLYNRIISHRNSYVKIARREIRRKFKNAPVQPIFRFRFLKIQECSKCLLCKANLSKYDNHVKCSTDDCIGIYCFDCYSCLQYCSICTDPAKYGDLSDLSEEKDSSEEDETKGKCTETINITLDENKRQSLEGNTVKPNKPDFEKSLEKPQIHSKNNLRLSVSCKIFKACRRRIIEWERNRKFSGSISSNARKTENKTVGRKCERKAETVREESKNGNMCEKQPTSNKEERIEVSQKETLREKIDFESEKERPKPDFLFKTPKPGKKRGRKASTKDSTELLSKSRTREKVSSIPKNAKYEETPFAPTITAPKHDKETLRKSDGSKGVRFLMAKDSKEYISIRNMKKECLKKGKEKSTPAEDGFITKRHQLYETAKIDGEESAKPSRTSDQAQVRICSRRGSSSDSTPDSYRLCRSRKDSGSSSDAQRCKRTRQLDSNSDLNDGRCLKRTCKRTNLSKKFHPTELFIQIDSSEEKAKLSKRVKFSKTYPKNSECSLKEEVKFAVDYGNEIRPIGKRENLNEKSLRLSWAPDLLSDLPHPPEQEDSVTSTDTN